MAPMEDTSTHQSRWHFRQCGACAAIFRTRRGLKDESLECPYCDCLTETPLGTGTTSPRSAAGPGMPSPAPPPAGTTTEKTTDTPASPKSPSPAAPTRPAIEPGAADQPKPLQPRKAHEKPPAKCKAPDATARPVRARRSILLADDRIRPRYLLGLICILLLSGAIIFGLIRLFLNGTPVIDSDPELGETQFSSQSESPSAKRSPIITDAECQLALDAVRRCFGAATPEAMLPYIRFPDEVSPLMKNWYTSQPYQPTKLRALIRARLMEVNGGIRLLVLDIEDEQGKSAYYVVEQTPNSDMKVDWEVSARYQQMPLPEFQSMRPTQAMPFRVHAMLSDYYNNEYSDENRYLCVELTYPGDPTFKLWAYAERQSPVGIRLSGLLAFGADSLILDLCYPKGTHSRSSEQVEITALRQSSWFR